MNTLKTSEAEYASPEAYALLNANDLTSLEAACSLGEVMHRRYDAKSVAAATLHDGEQPVAVYIKKQWRAARLIPRMHAILTGKAFWSYPQREWWGIMRLRQLGLDAAEPLAIFRHRWHPFRAAIVTRAVPGQLTLTEMLSNGDVGRMTSEKRGALATKVATTIETIHNAGLGWRSMDIKHFYPVPDDNGEWRIWLIDCEGVFAPLKPRYRERERRSIVASIRKAGSSDPSLAEFAEPIERRLIG